MKTFTVFLVLMFGVMNAVAVAQDEMHTDIDTRCDSIRNREEQQACFKQLQQEQKEKFAGLLRNEASLRTAKIQREKKSQINLFEARLRTTPGGTTCGDGTDLGMGPLGWFYVWCCNSSGCEGGWL